MEKTFLVLFAMHFCHAGCSLGSRSGVLPVHFSEFIIRCAASRNILQWTVTQANASYFIIESSADGSNWMFAVRMKAANTGNTESNYSYTDPDATPARVFYRINAYERDGKKTVSTALRSPCSEGGALTIYPNPVKDFVSYTPIRQDL